jgi:AraC-like DNA-binding protein
LLLEVVDASARHARNGGLPSMSDVIRHIQSHLGEEVRLEDLAKRSGYSLSRFKARFKQETGLSPRQFIHRAKVEAAQQRLLSGNDSIGKIAVELGFPTSQYFATVFRRFVGMAPGSYRGARGRLHNPSQQREDRQG